MKYIIYILVCHILGWVMTGYFVVKQLSNKDIRSEGSCNIGALNSGRVVGAKGFVLTFLGDSIKGGAAVALGVALNYPKWLLLLGLISVVAGHIWPWPFKFRGGKGASSFIGGLLVYHPQSVIVLLIGTGLFYLLLKDFTVAGIGAILLWPVSEAVQGIGLSILLLEVILVLIIMVAHRNNMKHFYDKYFERR